MSGAGGRRGAGCSTRRPRGGGGGGFGGGLSRRHGCIEAVQQVQSSPRPCPCPYPCPCLLHSVCSIRRHRAQQLIADAAAPAPAVARGGIRHNISVRGHRRTSNSICSPRASSPRGHTRRVDSPDGRRGPGPCPGPCPGRDAGSRAGTRTRAGLGVGAVQIQGHKLGLLLPLPGVPTIELAVHSSVSVGSSSSISSSSSSSASSTTTTNCSSSSSTTSNSSVSASRRWGIVSLLYNRPRHCDS
jgi:hypothetical protein